MKIAYFIGTFKKEDGVTSVLLKMSEAAKNEGHKNIIVTGYVEDRSLSPVEVIEVPAVTFPLYKDYKLPLPGQKGFAAKLDEFKPDIIHVHSPDPIAWAALKYAKGKKIPIIATYHTDFIKYLPYYHLSLLKPLVWAMFRRLYNQMDLITTPSSVIAEDLTAHGIKKVLALPWGTNLEIFNPKAHSEEWRKEILKDGKQFIVFSASRITWEKDLKTLAGAYNLLKEKNDDFEMVIAGDGPALNDLKKLMPGTIFLGHLDLKELARSYASSDVFLFPSATETFGNVTLEAMASGAVPVVANSGGSKALVKNKFNGLICEPYSANDFYLKTLELLSSPEELKAIRENGLTFSKDYSWDEVFKKVFAIYKNLINKS